MWWRWVVKAAIVIGQTDWAKAFAKRMIEKLRVNLENDVQKIAEAASIAVPAAAEIRQGRIIRTKTDMLKPDQVVLVDGKRFRISRLISSGATETIYEADPVA